MGEGGGGERGGESVEALLWAIEARAIDWGALSILVSQARGETPATVSLVPPLLRLG